MKRIFLIACLLMSFSSCKVLKIKGEVEMDKIFENIEKQYYTALKELNAQGYDIDVKSTAVTLSNVKATNVSASLKILIVTGSYKNIQKKQTSITFSLQPPPKENKDEYLRAKGNGNFEIDKVNLSSMIYNAAVNFSKIPNEGNLTDHVVTLDISFSVENDGGISLSTPLGNITPTGSVEKDVQNGNEIKIIFDIVKHPIKKVS